MFLWTCWIQFWQHCWSLVVKCPITFRARSENSQKILLLQTSFFYSKCCSGHVESTSDNPDTFSWLKVWTVFARDPKLFLEICFFQNKCFRERRQPAEGISPTVWQTFAKIWEWVWKSNNFRKRSTTNCLSGQVKNSFDNPAEVSLTEVRTVFSLDPRTV